ncbi:Uma2 family endonuclease [Streptacidiphilus sp. MAP5-52]
MTIALHDDRTDMADESEELTLDAMFEALERMPVPEGCKVEIVEGAVYTTPQRDVHWDVILDVVEQLRTKYARARVKSDVRIDFPGRLNGFTTDVTALAKDATKTEKGRWRYRDIEFVAEVISRDTAANDYGPKRSVYTVAKVPVCLIVDPYTAQCHLFTLPKDGEYRNELTLDFGDPVDLTGTVVGLVLATDEFPRD